MEFSVIKEIGSAFLVGAAALLVFEGFLYFSTGWTMTGFFRLPLGIDPPRDKPDKPDMMESSEHVERVQRENAMPEDAEPPPGDVRAGVFVALALISGILIEAIAEKPVGEGVQPMHAFTSRLFGLITDERTRDSWGISAAATLNDLRTDVLRRGNEWTSLGGEIKMQKLPEKYCRSLLGENAELSDDCLLKLFYTAKNWSFMQDTVYDELASLQARIHLVGALSFICIFLLPLVFAFLGVGLYWSVKGGNFLRWIAIATGMVFNWLANFFLFFDGRQNSNWSAAYAALALSVVATVIAVSTIHFVRNRVQESRKPDSKSISTRLMLLFVLLFIGHLAAYWAYAREEEEFAQRVFGYFSTAHALGEALKPALQVGPAATSGVSAP